VISDMPVKRWVQCAVGFVLGGHKSSYTLCGQPLVAIDTSELSNFEINSPKTRDVINVRMVAGQGALRQACVVQAGSHVILHIWYIKMRWQPLSGMKRLSSSTG
jgi:hypothetical protein